MISSVTEALKPQETAAFSSIDKDAFLKLLVAQLRYQNPLSPLDGQEYLAQSAQFATIERLDQLAKAQSEAVAYQQVILSSSLVGKTVSGTPMGLDEQVTGKVTGLRFESGVPLLVVGEHEIPVGNVEEVVQSPADA